MSNRNANGFAPYDCSRCDYFLLQTAVVAQRHGVKIYWKDSIRKFADSPFNREYVFDNKDISVGRN